MYVYKTTYNLTSDKINHLKIVQISDIHFCKNYNLKRFEKIYISILSEKPNYICIVGDLIDDTSIIHSKEINKLFKFFEKLGTICKVLIVLGNHDIEKMVSKKRIYDYPTIFVNKLRRLHNVFFLDDEMYKDKNVCFIGYNPIHKYYEEKESDFSLFEDNFKTDKFKINKNNYNILLLHSPVGILIHKNKVIDNFDLVLCGHTHGGMIPSWMFGNRGLISPGMKLLPHNMRGKIKINNTYIIISSGIMKLSKRSKLMKFNDLYAMDINIIKINP